MTAGAAEHGVRSLAVKLDVGYVDWRTLYPKHDRDGGETLTPFDLFWL